MIDHAPCGTGSVGELDCFTKRVNHMQQNKRARILIVLAVLNTLAMIAAPTLMQAATGYARSISMSKYRDLEKSGVITTSSDNAKSYPTHKLSGDWGDVSLYLTEGFSLLDKLAFVVAGIFAINAVILFLLWLHYDQSNPAVEADYGG
jgi:hypothetical protein